MKLLGELNARRKDRVDQISKRGTTFLSMVQEFRDRKIRENQGRHMELVRLAKEKKKREWRKPTVFPDGTLDCVLLDSESELPKSDIVLLNKNNKSFMDSSPEQRHDLLVALDKEAKEYQTLKRPTHYFRMMKELTLWGYFTSEIGATKALRYVAVPGKYEGCIDYKKGDKAWAT